MKKINFLEVLNDRGLINDTTNFDLLSSTFKGDEMQIGYVGFDGTASSLHVGHLLPIMMLRWFQKCGHKPIIVVGGATTRIGDPTGKDTSRPMLSEEEINQNIQSITKTFENFLVFDESKPNCAVVLDNFDWISKANVYDFMTDFGNHAMASRMLSRDSVKIRMEKEDPLTFMEFSYQMLQAYDFYYLNHQYGCTLQMGGSDQWGNIVAGVELVGKLSSSPCHAITCPLVVRADGKKMGKSEGGAIWLSESKLSAEEYKKYWLQVPNEDVSRFLKFFTELETDTIDNLVLSDIDHAKNILAQEVTRLCHREALSES